MSCKNSFLTRSILSIVLLTLLGGSVSAASSSLSRSYKATGALYPGSLVSLNAKQPGSVIAANTKNAEQLVGVIVSRDASLITVNESSNTVQVVSSGIADTLVTTVNGPVKAGDQIAVSPFTGIGMLAREGDKVIGLAQGSLTDASAAVIHKTVVGKNGKKQQLSVGFVRIGIAIGVASGKSSGASSVLGKFAQGIAGHPISTARLYLSIAIAVTAISAIMLLIYTSIFGGIVAIGRNPLAKNTILKTVASVMAMVVVLASIALVSISFLLR
jgi:hypothetical protein